jgi:hypothetical protein
LLNQSSFYTKHKIKTNSLSNQKKGLKRPVEDSQNEEKAANRKILIQENGQEFFKSIKEDFKTSLLTNNEQDTANSADTQQSVVVGSVNEMAKILVNSIMTVAIDEAKETAVNEEENIEEVEDTDKRKSLNSSKLKSLRYYLNGSASSKNSAVNNLNFQSRSTTPKVLTAFFSDQRASKQSVNEDAHLHEFTYNKSSSRLSYYKVFCDFILF